jgi:hypothetical protein
VVDVGWSVVAAKVVMMGGGGQRWVVGVLYLWSAVGGWWSVVGHIDGCGGRRWCSAAIGVVVAVVMDCGGWWSVVY